MSRLVRSPSSSHTRDRREISRLREELQEARARLQEFADAAASGPRAPEAGATSAHRAPATGGDRGDSPEEENPFRDMSAADIVAYLAGGYDFVDEDGDPSPDARADNASHGTHVHGTANAVTNNGYGVAGVAWDARSIHARIIGEIGATASDISARIKELLP